MTDKEFEELKALFSNKYVQKYLTEKQAETNAMDSLSTTRLNTQEELHRALEKKGIILGRMEIIEDLLNFAEKDDA